MGSDRAQYPCGAEVAGSFCNDNVENSTTQPLPAERLPARDAAAQTHIPRGQILGGRRITRLVCSSTSTPGKPPPAIAPRASGSFPSNRARPLRSLLLLQRQPPPRSARAL